MTQWHNYNSIPDDYAASFKMDWDWSDDAGWGWATVTNWTWVLAQNWYQSEELSWGATTSFTYSSITYTNSYIWIDWVFTKNSSKVTATALNWVSWEQYSWLRMYNRTLSDSEEQALELEGKRRLGDRPNYPQLLNWLVGYFRAEDWWNTVLYDLVNWTKATYVWWSNTTDNLGYSKAITNPNYTWSSITYTTWYTFEDSWAGWVLETSPTWLSATWINRTTDLRDVYLFNRTLSTDEENTLETLCWSYYPFEWSKWSTLALQDGLVMNLDWDGNDLSGNGNTWTLTNSPTKIRIWQASWLDYIAASSQYITWSITWTDINSLWLLFNPDSTSTWALIALTDWTARYRFEIYINSGNLQILWIHNTINLFGWFPIVKSSINTWEWYYLSFSSWSAWVKVYVNWVEEYTNWWVTTTFDANYDTYRIATRNTAASTFFNWKILSPKIRDNTLTQREFQSEKLLNFIPKD